MNLITEIGADVMKVGHRRNLWCHNVEDVIEHFSGGISNNKS